ncbi:uncharacterized protein F5147DRAFT_148907 [Suillus discolor]|uniref:Uncharacterized protein n=1 Tax=Suillus discolor TaxID=1912936 RepID=A0A9P7F9A7_9AGAM|nr:uncharacterized protein F5147DRAFT_148907 [Suillus discolor]KAG2109680.1 hypothetical protein F5147DRAFT_148907 [Suillus discolor]
MEGLDSIWKRYPAFRIAGALNIHFMQEDAFKFGRPTDLHCRRVKNTVDINTVKKWIKLCHASHGDTCKVSRIGEHDKRILPGFVRVVDIVLMAVVPAPSGCRYMAPSYIWGGIGAGYWTTKDNIAECGTPGRLSTKSSLIPSLIRLYSFDNLVNVTYGSMLYATTIHNMDLVHGLSYLTIIGCPSLPCSTFTFTSASRTTIALFDDQIRNHPSGQRLLYPEHNVSVHCKILTFTYLHLCV